MFKKLSQKKLPDALLSNIFFFYVASIWQSRDYTHGGNESSLYDMRLADPHWLLVITFLFKFSKFIPVLIAQSPNFPAWALGSSQSGPILHTSFISTSHSLSLKL